MKYKIEFAEPTKEHFRHLKKHQRITLLSEIERQLTYEPLKETKKRKKLDPNPQAPWELRMGNLRVFYEVTANEPDKVKILAVGYKQKNKLYISGKEIEL